MSQPQGTWAKPCTGITSGLPCQSFAPGHHVHSVHAGLIARAPWGWRTALVTNVQADDVIDLLYVGGGTVRAWHHARITPTLKLAQRIGVHEGLHALRINGRLLNAHLTDGIGPVREPNDLTEWTGQLPAGANLENGEGLLGIFDGLNL